MASNLHNLLLELGLVTPGHSNKCGQCLLGSVASCSAAPPDLAC